MMLAEPPDVFRVSSSVPLEDDQPLHWTVALACGEDAWLQEYIQHRVGRRIPKQYCQLLGSRSLLQHTLARLNQLTPASRTLTVIGTDHKPYAMRQLSEVSDHVFCQPVSRDTGLALYVALAMIKRWTPNATVTITPTDHYIEPGTRYLDHLQVAHNVATRSRDLVVILGVRPTEPDPDFGYLQIAERLNDMPEANRLVGLVARPSVARAQELIGAGALWNTMVTCGTLNALWALGRSTRSHLMRALDRLVPLIGTPDESDAIEHVYRTHSPISFSADMLERAANQLVAIELDGVEWSDWNRPERVETELAVRTTRASS
jgi:mannose-1-phosphate guanylyltransferase